MSGARRARFGPRSPFDALDEHSQAAVNVGEILFDASMGALAEDFTGQIENLGDRVLILAEIEIDPRYRGQGLGSLIAGLVIETLSPGALAVGLQLRAAASTPGRER